MIRRRRSGGRRRSPSAPRPSSTRSSESYPPTCACCSARSRTRRYAASSGTRTCRPAGRKSAPPRPPGGGGCRAGSALKTASAPASARAAPDPDPPKPASRETSRRKCPKRTGRTFSACSTSRATRKSRSRRPPRRWTTAWPLSFPSRWAPRPWRSWMTRSSRTTRRSLSAPERNTSRCSAPAWWASSPGRARSAARARTIAPRWTPWTWT